MTEEQRRISRANNAKARKYFGLDLTEQYMYVLHHKDESLRHDNIERYILWLPEDLVVMTNAEHTAHHSKGKVLSEETRIKISNSHIGKLLSCDTKIKMTASRLGRHWYNNGINEIFTYECPVGYKKGRLNPEKYKTCTGRHWKLVDGKRVYYD